MLRIKKKPLDSSKRKYPVELKYALYYNIIATCFFYYALIPTLFVMGALSFSF